MSEPGAAAASCQHCGALPQHAGTECPRTHRSLSEPGPCGQRVGRYLVQRLLSAGGMGGVYVAQHTLLGHLVALKLLHREVVTSPGAVERFLAEARAAMRIQSAHVVRVLDFDVADGLPFMAMELLDGTDLEQMLRQKGALPPAQAVELTVQLLEGLGSAHAVGVVHRDVKPANILLVRAGSGALTVRVVDFGISKLLEGGSGLTATSVLLGTPLYMAPEQMHDARDVDARADLYAVGALLYEMLAGRPPYVAASFEELLAKVFAEPPTPLREVAPWLAPELVSVVEAAMSRDRTKRPADAATLTAALNWALQHGGSSATPPPSSANAWTAASTGPTQWNASHDTPQLGAAKPKNAPSFAPPAFASTESPYLGATPVPKAETPPAVAAPAAAVAAQPSPAKRRIPVFVWVLGALVVGAGVSLGAVWFFRDGDDEPEAPRVLTFRATPAPPRVVLVQPPPPPPLLPPVFIPPPPIVNAPSDDDNDNDNDPVAQMAGMPGMDPATLQQIRRAMAGVNAFEGRTRGAAIPGISGAGPSFTPSPGWSVHIQQIIGVVPAAPINALLRGLGTRLQPCRPAHSQEGTLQFSISATGALLAMPGGHDGLDAELVTCATRVLIASGPLAVPHAGTVPMGGVLTLGLSAPGR